MGEVVQEGYGGHAVVQGARDPRARSRRSWGERRRAEGEVENNRNTGFS